MLNITKNSKIATFLLAVVIGASVLGNAVYQLVVNDGGVDVASYAGLGVFASVGYALPCCNTFGATMTRALLIALAILTIAVTARHSLNRHHHHAPGIFDAR